MNRTNSKRVVLPKAGEYNCFGCGSANPIGLKMAFYVQEGTVRADVVLGQNHVGWENIAHGGIISTMLDEIMGWSVVAFKGVFFVTRRLEVRFLRPVPVGVPLTAIGCMDPEVHPKGCKASGWIQDSEGEKLASATAQFTFLSGKRLDMVPAGYKREMSENFERIRQILSDTLPIQGS